MEGTSVWGGGGAAGAQVSQMRSACVPVSCSVSSKQWSDRIPEWTVFTVWFCLDLDQQLLSWNRKGIHVGWCGFEHVQLHVSLHSFRGPAVCRQVVLGPDGPLMIYWDPSESLVHGVRPHWQSVCCPSALWVQSLFIQVTARSLSMKCVTNDFLQPCWGILRFFLNIIYEMASSHTFNVIGHWTFCCVGAVAFMVHILDKLK